jgi:hypothetical protein
MSSFVQLDVNSSLGALVAGCWLNSALYAIELLQMWSFFTKSTQGAILKIILAFLLLVDTICTLSESSAPQRLARHSYNSTCGR